MRVVFAGTPEPAVPALRALLESGRHEVAAVLTRPDAPAGRGRTVTRSAVGRLADAAGLPVLTPHRPADPDFLARLREIAPDCCPVVAYGALVPRAALDVPVHGWVNLHFSLLPAWRGAAPVAAALRHGDEITGATTFRLEEGLDTGPVFGVLTEPVGPTDTAGDLLGRLAESGAALLLATLDAIADGTAAPRPQPADGVSHAPKITADDARVDWAAPPSAVDRLVRSVTPDPGAWTTFRGARLGLGPIGAGTSSAGPGAGTSAAGPGAGPGAAGPGGSGAGHVGAVPPGRTGSRTAPLGDAPPLKPGELCADKRRVLVGTAGAPVELREVRPVGKRAMAAADWARGVRIEPGELLV